MTSIVKKRDWSFSALNMMRRCTRMYFFQYIAATHGFANAFRRKVFELKKSKNLLMWRGSVIDKIMEVEVMPKIQAKQKIDFESVADLAVALAKRQYEFSKSAQYAIKGNSESKIGADYCILDIHLLNRPYTSTEIEAVYTAIRQIVLGIPSITMPDGKNLIDFLYTASFMIPNMDKWSFEFENLVINPQLDLFMIMGNKLVVLDWKVSESDVSDYSRQLVIGGITVFDVYRKKAQQGGRKYAFDDIRLIEVNLLKKGVKEHTFDQTTVNECIDFIYLNGEDIALLTHDKSFDELDINDFPITDKESTCVFCKFRTVCVAQITNQYESNEAKYHNPVQNKKSEQLTISF
jgi:hypothetical protein